MGPAPVRTGLAPTRTSLPNGVVVLAKAARATPAVTINLTLRAGSISDPADATGAAFLLSRLLDRGTVTRSAEEIAEELDSRGIALAVTVTRHALAIVCTCLSEDFEPVLALLGDMVMAPSLPEAEIATRKGQIITAIRQDEDNPGIRAVEALMAQLYPSGHPYGRPAKGTVESVETMTRERLSRLHADRFAPGEVCVVIVGDVEVARSTDAASRVFGEWRTLAAPPIVVPHVTPATRRERRVIQMMNKAQADIAYGFSTITRADPAYYAFWLLNNALGEYAMGGKLGDSIRERQGMAYYVYSSLDATVIEGPLIIRAGVSPANVDRAIASIDEEIRIVRHAGLTEQELNESRQYLIGSMPRTLETNSAIARFLQTVEFFGLGLDYDVRVPDLLGRVTRDDIQAAAERALDPDRATVVIAGPYEER